MKNSIARTSRCRPGSVLAAVLGCWALFQLVNVMFSSTVKFPALDPFTRPVLPRGKLANDPEKERRNIMTTLMQVVDKTPALRDNFNAYNQICMDYVQAYLAEKEGQIMPHHFDAGRMDVWNHEIRWKPLPLDPDSNVVYVGAHRTGSDGEELHKLYGSNIYMYEPIPDYFRELSQRFAGKSKFHPVNVGLGNMETTVRLPRSSLQEVATFVDTKSGGGGGGDTVPLHIRPATAAIKDLGLDRMDLLHVNCEGCEYDMYEDLAKNGMFGKFDIIQHSFHYYFPQESVNDVLRRYCRINWALAQTHEYDEDSIAFGWERWTRRKPVASS